jgi:ATP-dependent DNA ligase
LIAFDLLRLDGAICAGVRSKRGGETLMWLVDGVDRILFSEALAAEGAVVLAKACELGLEGIVEARQLL